MKYSCTDYCLKYFCIDYYLLEPYKRGEKNFVTYSYLVDVDFYSFATRLQMSKIFFSQNFFLLLRHLHKSEPEMKSAKIKLPSIFSRKHIQVTYSQPELTCAKPTTEAPEQYVKSRQS